MASSSLCNTSQDSVLSCIGCADNAGAAQKKYNPYLSASTRGEYGLAARTHVRRLTLAFGSVQVVHVIPGTNRPGIDQESNEHRV